MNLTDGRTQHLLAGTVKTSEEALSEEHGHDSVRFLGQSDADKEAWLWLGQQTLELGSGPQSDSQRFFVVPDMSQHERLKTLSSLAGPPFLKFCAAAPLRTKLDISIGYLLVVYNTARHSLSGYETDCVTSMASQCMGQLDMARGMEVRRRGVKMSDALESFIRCPPIIAQILEEPPSFKAPPRKPPPRENQRRNARGNPHSNAITPNGNEMDSNYHAAGSPKQPDSRQRHLPTHEPNPALQRGSDQHTQEPRHLSAQIGTNDNQQHDNGETTYRKTFRRAAEYLHKFLEVDGVLFGDGLVGFHGGLLPAAEPEQELEREMAQRPERKPLESETNHEADATTAETLEPADPGLDDAKEPSTRTFTSADFQKNVYLARSAEILGMSRDLSRTSPRFEQLSESTLGLRFVTEGFLQHFIAQHPKGRTWYFDEEGRPYCFRGDALVPDEYLGGDAGDAERVLHAFPGMRQFIFAPLTDPVTSKSLAGCFVWSTSVLPVLTDMDLQSVRTFLHIVEAEISRIDTIAAVKQQESFVSSVSHELRSPLHGVLGAVEFLLETGLDNFQEGLADTIHSCGTTLHETLSSVLSFAKINEFERRAQKPQLKGPKESPWALENKDLDPTQPDGGNQSLFACTNVAKLCEEIVEVVEGGHLHSTSTTDSLLTVTLDIAFRRDWYFMTEPGALRRIMMNIIGNALKYSTKGFVKVSLHTEHNTEAEKDVGAEFVPDELVIFTVTDSGKGMSKEFLENHLFVPFSQEDAVASQGVGLGMSIVKSLVAVLGGRIEVKSQLGQGTEIKVGMPMNAGSPGPQDASAMASTFERDISILRGKALKVGTFDLSPSVEKSLYTYLTDWFRCTVLPSDDENLHLDVAFVGETNDTMSGELRSRLHKAEQQSVVRVISIGPRKWARSRHAADNRTPERVSLPFGPNKILKALLKCVEQGGSPNGVEKALGTAAAATPAKGSEQRSRERAVNGNAAVDPGAPSEAAATTGREETRARASSNSSSITRTASHTSGGADPAPRKRQEMDRLSIAHRWRSSPDSGATTTHRTTSADTLSLRLLLVEDNPVNLKLLKTYMIKRGYKDIEVAGNGLLAVQAVEKRADGFDIIIMDISMPEMDGFEATRIIRELEAARRSSSVCAPSTPAQACPAPALIIALTGLASAKDRAAAFRNGANLFVTKPVSFQKLGVLLGQWEKGEISGASGGVEEDAGG